ncbi:hypothetical protein CLERM_468 [Coxiella-like endosymbiont]|nr:hypothetical protein CLERM_468 [Coxiella-like endosymbiont]
MERLKNSHKVDERIKITAFTDKYITDLVEIAKMSILY